MRSFELVVAERREERVCKNVCVTRDTLFHLTEQIAKHEKYFISYGIGLVSNNLLANKLIQITYKMRML